MSEGSANDIHDRAMQYAFQIAAEAAAGVKVQPRQVRGVVMMGQVVRLIEEIGIQTELRPSLKIKKIVERAEKSTQSSDDERPDSPGLQALAEVIMGDSEEPSDLAKILAEAERKVGCPKYKETSAERRVRKLKSKARRRLEQAEEPLKPFPVRQ